MTYFQPGDECNEYKIVRLLGEGGCGSVYEVRRTQPMLMGVVQDCEEAFALKCLPPSQETNRRARERLNQEMVVLKRLKHKNIVRFESWGITDNNRAFFVMDLLEGKTLAEDLKNGRLSVRRSLEVARDIAEALVFAHEKGVIHRDLKPGNVFLCGSDVKLLDLGAAKYKYTWDRSNPGERSPGTDIYLSPEMWDPAKEVDHRSDVFQLAQITYEMLTGRHPFTSEAKTVAEARAHQMQYQKRPLGDFGIPEYVASVIHRGLEVDREKRQQSMAELLSELLDAYFRSACPCCNQLELARERAFAPVVEMGSLTHSNGSDHELWWRARGSQAPTPPGDSVAVFTRTTRRVLGLPGEAKVVIAPEATLHQPGDVAIAEQDRGSSPVNEVVALDRFRRRRPRKETIRSWLGVAAAISVILLGERWVANGWRLPQYVQAANPTERLQPPNEESMKPAVSKDRGATGSVARSSESTGGTADPGAISTGPSRDERRYGDLGMMLAQAAASSADLPGPSISKRKGGPRPIKSPPAADERGPGLEDPFKDGRAERSTGDNGTADVDGTRGVSPLPDVVKRVNRKVGPRKKGGPLWEGIDEPQWDSDETPIAPKGIGTIESELARVKP